MGVLCLNLAADVLQHAEKYYDDVEITVNGEGEYMLDLRKLRQPNALRALRTELIELGAQLDEQQSDPWVKLHVQIG